MFYVYYGYVGPDNHDSSETPTYQIKECTTSSAVLEFKKEFDEELDAHCSNIIFRVFEGEERLLRPVAVVTEYTL